MQALHRGGLGQGDLEVVDEIFFDRYVSHQPDGSTLERGPEDVKQFIGEFWQAFPDYRITIEYQIAEGDKVVTRWRSTGTHQGEFRGITPTGNRVQIMGIGVFRFSEEGKVVETWDSYDQLSLMRQRIEQELRVARRIQQAFSLRAYPSSTAGRSPTTTSLPGKWAETSTTSWS